MTFFECPNCSHRLTKEEMEYCRRGFECPGCGKANMRDFVPVTKCPFCHKDRITSTSLTTGCCMGEVTRAFDDAHKKLSEMRIRIHNLLETLKSPSVDSGVR